MYWRGWLAGYGFNNENESVEAVFLLLA